MTSSPTYARANGQADTMFQVSKNLIKKSSAEGTSYHLGLQEIRNTPITNGMLTPAQLLQGGTLRSKIPGPEKALVPYTYDQARVKHSLQKGINNHKFYHDKKAGPEKEILKPGNQVRVHLQGKLRRAVVSKHLPEPGSYQVETDDGTRYRRNRMHINRNLWLTNGRTRVVSYKVSDSSEHCHDVSTATRDESV